MENENSVSQAQSDNQPNDTEVDYISALKEIKENSVSKEQYLKVKEENKKLLQSLVEGGQAPEYPREKVDLNELRKKLESDEISNLEYVETALKLRNEIIETEDRDIFVPKDNITPETIATAEKVAAVFQECVDLADGNSHRFTTELLARMSENQSALMKQNKLNRR